MPKGDPRQAKVVTTWALRGDKIYFDETGQYQFLSKDGACTASARRTRLLSRLVEGPTETGPSADPTPGSAAPGPVSNPEPIGRKCGAEERAVRVELALTSRLLRAGDTLTVDSQGLSSSGCRVNGPARIEFPRGRELLEEAANGVFRVRPDAPSGTLTVRAIIDQASAEVQVDVVSRNEIESLFAGSLPEGRGAPPPGPTGPSGSSVAATPTAPEPDRTPLLIGLGLGLLGCAAALGILWRRSVKRRRATGVSLGHGPDALAQGAVGSSVVGASAAAPGLGGLAGAPTLADSSIQRPITTSMAPPQGPPTPKGRVCPTCGARYPDSEAFCGKDGARLLREN